MLLSNELLHLIRWQWQSENRRMKHKIPHIINQQNIVRLSTAIESCHNHYWDNDSGVKALLWIKTLQIFQKRWCEGSAMKGRNMNWWWWWWWWWEWHCNNNRLRRVFVDRVAVVLETKPKKKKTAEMWVLHRDISSQVLMRSKLDKASRSAHTVLNTAMRNAIMIMMVW